MVRKYLCPWMEDIEIGTHISQCVNSKQSTKLMVLWGNGSYVVWHNDRYHKQF